MEGSRTDRFSTTLPLDYPSFKSNVIITGIAANPDTDPESVLIVDGPLASIVKLKIPYAIRTLSKFCTPIIAGLQFSFTHTHTYISNKHLFITNQSRIYVHILGIVSGSVVFVGLITGRRINDNKGMYIRGVVDVNKVIDEDSAMVRHLRMKWLYSTGQFNFTFDYPQKVENLTQRKEFGRNYHISCVQDD